MNKEAKTEEEIKVEKINRRYLYGHTKISAKRRFEWWNKTSAETVSILSKKYGSKINK